ncbi:MAG: gamma-glutamyl-gamma-aminobutyrate hydrolase family protein, partial [Dysgonamonadaceae bacterium]
MNEKIIILDFGSPTTQLIGRKIRELNTYCEIVPYNKFPHDDKTVKGVILSGSPLSVNEPNAFKTDLSAIRSNYPVMGICYGAQLTAQSSGGEISQSSTRKYGHARVRVSDHSDALLGNLPQDSPVWLSLSDAIIRLPENFRMIASTEEVEIAAYKVDDEPTWGVQFHPESPHT